jgi:hypothetical protein
MMPLPGNGPNRAKSLTGAAIAQQVEQLICNQQVGGSTPSSGWPRPRQGPRITVAYAFRRPTDSSARPASPLCMCQVGPALPRTRPSTADTRNPK